MGKIICILIATIIGASAWEVNTENTGFYIGGISMVDSCLEFDSIPKSVRSVSLSSKHRL